MVVIAAAQNRYVLAAVDVRMKGTNGGSLG